MPTFEIICLANSSKPGGRCIAGLKTDSSGWFRPVSSIGNGALSWRNYSLDNGNEPQLFDIVRVSCSAHCSKCHQPENWVINGQSWEFVGLPSLEQIRKLLNPEVNKNSASPKLFGNLDRKICYSTFKQNPALSSLAIIKPYGLEWIVERFENEKKYKAKFLLGGFEYKLPVTDPIWKKHLSSLDENKYSSEQVIEELELKNFDPNNFLLTISLGEPFPSDAVEGEQFCYKLIAAVINTSEVKKRLGLC